MDSGQKAELTLEELSRSTGEPVERLGQWRSLGLIGAEDGEGFRPEDVERVRLVQLLLRRGIGLEAIAKADREQRFLGHYLELMFPEGVTPSYSLAEAAEILSVDLELLRKVWTASGFSGDDVERARLVQALLRRGISLEAVAQADREQGFLSHYLELTFPEGVAPSYSLAEAAEILGVDLERLAVEQNLEPRT